MLILLLACSGPSDKPPVVEPPDDTDCVEAEWYADADGDGFGADAGVLTACEAPAGTVELGGDCDDADATVHPGEVELCNDRDDDCDGAIDGPGVVDAPTWFEDGDGDGFGDPDAALSECDAPAGWVADGTDCDDTVGSVFPGADETCDGVDQDCDGEADEDDAVDAPTWYLDADGDGWGAAGDAVRACALPEGRAADPGDCDDGAPAVHPAAIEACNAVDDDCDGATDEPDAVGARAWYTDADADGFGDPDAPVVACEAPPGTVPDATDCDDTTALASPVAAETCDGVDDDCDGAVDEPDAVDASTWFLDADADGYGDPTAPARGCEPPAGHLADASDCDDTDAATFPAAPERLDDADDDCDGQVDEVAHPWQADLVTNGDFELGDLTGWTLEEGPCEVVESVDWITPFDGAYMLHGGEGATGDCRVSQTFDLLALGFVEADLDSGRAGLDATAVLANEVDEPWSAWFTTFDRVFLRVRYLDAYDVELGSVRTLLSEDDEWAARGTGGLLPEGTRKLVLEVQGKLRKGTEIDSVADAVAMSVTVEAPTSPTITRLPFLQDHRQDAMTLLWETDGNLATHVVEWAPSGDALTNVVTTVDTVEIDASHYVHVATIEGLTAGTTYDYRVGSGDSWSDTYTFRTAPADGEAFQIGWTGDNQNGPTTFAGHLSAMMAQGADLFISPGDVVHNGTWSGDDTTGWAEEWFTPMEDAGFSATRPVLFARGNHDNHYSLSYAYSALPENEDWYSFTYGNLFVVVLDSNSVTDSSLTVLSQMEYLEDALSSDAAINADFRIVTFHNPPYTNSRHDYSQTGFTNAQDDWVPLFEDHDVDMVVGGHFHAYQRGEHNGVTYVVVGGGGGRVDTYVVELYDFFEVVEQVHHYALMSVDGPTLDWTVYDTSGAVLDTFTLTAE